MNQMLTALTIDDNPVEVVLADCFVHLGGVRQEDGTCNVTLDTPWESVLADCIVVYRERAQKYTHSAWDDNFQFIARGMREYGKTDFSAADAATVLMLVKEARQDAARKSGRTDFADDSYRDSEIDDINYRAIRRALKDEAGAEMGEERDVEVAEIASRIVRRGEKDQTEKAA